MAANNLEAIAVILGTTMGTQEWELQVPVDVPAQALIGKFLRTPDLGFKEQDDNGNTIPYRLMWNEGKRALRESESLRQAGVQPGNKLVMAHEARAGAH